MFNKAYRGIIKKIGEDLGLTPQAISSSYRRNHPETVKLVNREIRKTNAVIAEKEKLVAAAY